MNGILVPTQPGWPVTLRAGALVLRPLRRADQANWNQVRAANVAWLAQWDATAPPQMGPGVGSFVDMLRGQRAQARDGRALPWVLAWDESWPKNSTHSSLIGQITVSGIVRGSAQSAYIGYWIDHRWAGRGLVPLGVALASDYCFQTLRLHRLEIDILPENERSHKVVAKVGYRPDGQRSSMLHINGTWRDHDAFIMTEDEAPRSLTARLLAGRGVPTGDSS